MHVIALLNLAWLLLIILGGVTPLECMVLTLFIFIYLL